MDYVFPIPSWLKGEMLTYKRLYAFPAMPEEKPFILDSGAFALSKSGKKMDDAYLDQLHKYYTKYPAYHVAPDVFLNPEKSMDNFDIWCENYPDCLVFPVVQFQVKEINILVAQYQLDFYFERFKELEVLFISNPSLLAWNYPVDFFQEIKNKYQVNYIHLLGAGWNLQDVQRYACLPELDSIDSIAYYNSTNTERGNWSKIKGNKKQIAIENAKRAKEVIL